VENALIIGCGYVGKAVAQTWRSRLRVTVTTTTRERVPELAPIADRVLLLHGSDPAAMRSSLPNQAIVLLSVGARRSEGYEVAYLQTAKTLVEALATAPNVRQVIYTSSYAVYGDQQGDWVTEETPVAPANRNGEILAATEQLLLSAATSTRQVCVLRLGGIYGPGREIGRIFRSAAGTTRPGDGSDAANWVHLDDIVGAINLVQQRSLGGVYNLVGDVPITVRELLELVCTQNQLPPVTWDASQSSPRPYNARVSNQKLRSASYQFRHPEVRETR
jgi:nucleoside-diphosphate-sugar epimerase